MLETERLRLRAWRRDDREHYFAILQEPAVFRHFGPKPMGMEECWRRLMAAAGGRHLNGHRAAAGARAGGAWWRRRAAGTSTAAGAGPSSARATPSCSG